MGPIVTRKNIIQQAVNRLKNLGFVRVTSANIMCDDVYLYYFLKMLREYLQNESVPTGIVKELLNEINDLRFSMERVENDGAGKEIKYGK